MTWLPSVVLAGAVIVGVFQLARIATALEKLVSMAEQGRKHRDYDPE
jgi:hypothetical protein